MKTGIELIAEERRRHIEKERWTPEHDSTHVNGELAIAGACYAIPSYDTNEDIQSKLQWPFEKDSWKPSGDRVRDLVKAGALIAAEIDRINVSKDQDKMIFERQKLIPDIEGLYPTDCEFEETNKIGTTLLIRAIENISNDWRLLPIEVLREYHRLCIDEENNGVVTDELIKQGIIKSY